MIAGAFLIIAFAGAAIVIVVLSSVTRSGSDADGWARTNAIDLTPATQPVVALYLRNSRALRRIGALGGIVLPAAVTAGTGIDLHLSAVTWVLLGYLSGQIVAELTLARVPAPEHRAASLATRRLLDYLPRPLLVTQVALPVVAVGVSVVVARAGFDPVDGVSAVELDQARTGALLAAPLAVVLAIVVLVGERRLVRRPQPIIDPDLVALDDAMRSSSLRAVSATSVAVTALLITTQLSALALGLGPGGPQLALGIASASALVLAYCCWQWWVKRGWRVHRADSPPIPEVVP